MLRRLVIIVLSLLAIASGLYWIDIYRPRTTTAELYAGIEAFELELEESCGTGWRDLRESLSNPRHLVESSCSEVSDDAALRKVQRIRGEHTMAKHTLKTAIRGGNTARSSPRTKFLGVDFIIVKTARLTPGRTSRRLRAVATVRRVVPWKARPAGASGANRWVGDFGYYRGEEYTFEGHLWTCLKISMPMWAVSMLLAAYPVIALLSGPLRRRRRRARGLCAACGYNLTGLPSAICPECGAAGEVKSLKDTDSND